MYSIVEFIKCIKEEKMRQVTAVGNLAEKPVKTNLIYNEVINGTTYYYYYLSIMEQLIQNLVKVGKS